jgi:uncharacterized phosphosugar-binding protein
MGHSTVVDLIPNRPASPRIYTQGFDLANSQEGDVFFVDIWGDEEVLAKSKDKGVIIIGGPVPWGRDARNSHYIVRESAMTRVRPYADIWIETNVDTIGAVMNIPGSPSPVGPVSGVIGMMIYWMAAADICRIFARAEKPLAVEGDEPRLGPDAQRVTNLYDPLMDDYFERAMLEIEMVTAERGYMMEAAKMAVDTVLAGGTVYAYSQYESSLSSEATTRRGGLAMTQGVHEGQNGDLETHDPTYPEGRAFEPKEEDLVIMGIFEPNDSRDLTHLDAFKRSGCKIVSIGPMTENLQIPQGRTVPKEADIHIGRMSDTYGHYAFPGFNRTVCPSSGITMNQIFWSTCMEIITEMVGRTGNVPNIFFSAATRGGTEHMHRSHRMFEDRGY